MLLVCRMHLDGVPFGPEGPPEKRQVIAVILQVHETTKDLALVELVANPHGKNPILVLGRIAEAIDARHRRHHHHITSGQQGGCGSVPQAVDLIID